MADELAHDEIDAFTAAWFWDLQAVLETSGDLAPDRPRRHHGHGHGHGEHRGPYLHRYLADRLEAGEGGARLFLRLRELERLRVAQGLLVPIGLRLVADVPP